MTKTKAFPAFNDNFSTFLSELRRIDEEKYSKWLSVICTFIVSSDNIIVRGLAISLVAKSDSSLSKIQQLLFELRDLVLINNIKLDREFLKYYIEITNLIKDEKMARNLIEILNANKNIES